MDGQEIWVEKAHTGYTYGLGSQQVQRVERVTSSFLYICPVKLIIFHIYVYGLAKSFVCFSTIYLTLW